MEHCFICLSKYFHSVYSTPIVHSSFDYKPLQSSVSEKNLPWTKSYPLGTTRPRSWSAPEWRRRRRRRRSTWWAPRADWRGWPSRGRRPCGRRRSGRPAAPAPACRAACRSAARCSSWAGRTAPPAAGTRPRGPRSSCCSCCCCCCWLYEMCTQRNGHFTQTLCTFLSLGKLSHKKEKKHKAEWFTHRFSKGIYLLITIINALLRWTLI